MEPIISPVLLAVFALATLAFLALLVGIAIVFWRSKTPARVVIIVIGALLALGALALVVLVTPLLFLTITSRTVSYAGPPAESVQIARQGVEEFSPGQLRVSSPAATEGVTDTEKSTIVLDPKTQPPGSLGQVDGERLYQNNCGSCHGSRAGGGSGSALAGIAQRMKGDGISPEALSSILIAQVRKGNPGMLAVTEKQLSDTDIVAIAQYLITLPGPPATPEPSVGTPDPAPAGIPGTGPQVKTP